MTMDNTESSVAFDAVVTCLSIGVKEFIICSGARNAAIIAAITSLKGVRVYNHPEERSAAFFALGRAIIKQEPVAVVTTSGTAVAELLPAVIEGHYQAVPLVLLTADRPVRFWGKGAPQAIVQNELFGVYAEKVIDGWNASRPLHINLPLEEPSPAQFQTGDLPVLNNDNVAREIPSNKDDTVKLQDFLNRSKRCIVFVGSLPLSWREPVLQFLDRLDVPVWAEATSGIREELPLCSLDNDPESILRIGGVPSARLWRDLEEKPNVEVFSVSPNGLPGLARESCVITAPNWQELEVPKTFQRGMVCPNSHGEIFSKYPLSEHSWIRRVSECIPEKSLVFLGNSQPVREWDFAATRLNRGLKCFANRGVNGIDGCLSTFLGLSADERESWALVGDLTTLYDLAAPWIVSQLPHSNRRIVVINNGGGRIFRRLPALTNFSSSQMQMVENAHSLKFKGWAEMWGMAYRKVTQLEDLESLPDGFLLIELFPDLEQSDCFWRALNQ